MCVLFPHLFDTYKQKWLTCEHNNYLKEGHKTVEPERRGNDFNLTVFEEMKCLNANT